MVTIRRWSLAILLSNYYYLLQDINLYFYKYNNQHHNKIQNGLNCSMNLRTILSIMELNQFYRIVASIVKKWWNINHILSHSRRKNVFKNYSVIYVQLEFLLSLHKLILSAVEECLCLKMLFDWHSRDILISMSPISIQFRMFHKKCIFYHQHLVSFIAISYIRWNSNIDRPVGKNATEENGKLRG